MYFTGNMSTYLLCAISIERCRLEIYSINNFLINLSFRYLVFSNQITLRSITYKTCFLTILICVILSLIWTVVPLLGWSYYSPEGVQISCSVEWNDHSFNVMSYNIIIFIFAFYIPVIILVFTNVRVIKIVSMKNTFRLNV